MDDGDLETERGPRLTPISPILGLAMRYVLNEWETSSEWEGDVRPEPAGEVKPKEEAKAGEAGPPVEGESKGQEKA